jgi:hypothetical protein
VSLKVVSRSVVSRRAVTAGRSRRWSKSPDFDLYSLRAECVRRAGSKSRRSISRPVVSRREVALLVAVSTQVSYVAPNSTQCKFSSLFFLPLRHEKHEEGTKSGFSDTKALRAGENTKRRLSGHNFGYRMFFLPHRHIGHIDTLCFLPALQRPCVLHTHQT